MQPVIPRAGATDLIPVEAFARLPQISQPALSPDGSHIAYLAPIAGQRNLVITPLGERGKSQAIPPVEKTDIIWFEWMNNERLIISYRYTNEIHGTYARTALFSVHVREPGYVDMAKEPKLRDAHPYAQYIRQRPQLRDKVIDMLPDDPDHFLLAIDSDFDGRAEIRRVNVHTGHYVTLSKGYDHIWNWITDQNHEYRLGWGASFKEFRLLYIDPDTGKHREVNDKDWYEDADISPVGFTEDPHIAYAFEPHNGGKRRLVTFDVLKGQVKDVVFAHADADVSGVVTDPKTGRLVGASYTDDLSHTVYFDPDLAALKAQLDEWLPGGSNRILSWNREKGLYVIRHVSDRDDKYYLLDTTNGAANLIASAISIPADMLAKTERHLIRARDGLEIPAYLTLPPGKPPKDLPLVVLPHGGPHSRDTLHYNYWSQFLANRGYAVLRPNFRGSSGYGSVFAKLGEGQWGGKMQDDVTDATHWAIDQGYADPKEICIAGGSYGGYAALMGAIKEPDLYQCAVSINGVTNLVDLTRWMIREYLDEVGHESLSKEDVSPLYQADRITIPTLIIHAKDDSVVPYEHGEKMYKTMKRLNKDVTFKSLDTADHYFDTEQSRIEVLTALEAFLTKKLKK